MRFWKRLPLTSETRRTILELSNYGFVLVWHDTFVEVYRYVREPR